MKQQLIFCCAAAGLVLGGCSPVRVVQPGDQVGLHFDCRLSGGEMAASTHGGASNRETPKSAIFVPQKDDSPMTVVAGIGLVEEGPKPFHSFEQEIGSRLALQAAGMRPGETRVVELSEAARPAIGSQWLLSMARVRIRPKEILVPREDYLAGRGKEPVIGAEYTIDPLVPGRVTEVGEKEVTIRFTAEPGREVTTPFGKGVIRDAADHYEIDMDVRLGTLTRSGPLVGRIVKVDERNFVIDYNHPFGGEKLTCEMLAVPPAAGTTGSEHR